MCTSPKLIAPFQIARGIAVILHSVSADDNGSKSKFPLKDRKALIQISASREAAVSFIRARTCFQRIFALAFSVTPTVSEASRTRKSCFKCLTNSDIDRPRSRQPIGIHLYCQQVRHSEHPSRQILIKINTNSEKSKTYTIDFMRYSPFFYIVYLFRNRIPLKILCKLSTITCVFLARSFVIYQVRATPKRILGIAQLGADRAHQSSLR